MKIQSLFLVTLMALSAAGCAADHNDAVMPGYYDGYHIPAVDPESSDRAQETALLNEELNAATNTPAVKTNDDDQ